MTKAFYKRFFILVFSVFAVTRIQAQAEIANELVALANEMFQFGDYNDALEIYKQAIEFDEDNVEANFMAGRCYLKTTAYKANSVDHFLFVYNKNEEYNNMLLYYIAEGYRFDYEFDLAIEYFTKFENELNVNYRWFGDKDVEALKLRAAKRIRECQNAKKFTKVKKKISITNLGDVVNSEDMDYAPTLNLNEDILIFTSRRAGTTGGLKDVDNLYFEDIWVSYLENGEWTYPKNMGDVVNSESHDSNIGLSPDGKTLFIYKSDNGGDIYASKQKGDKWSKPKPFEKFINTTESETSICISSDDKYMFYSSSKEGGIGGLDLYMSVKDEKGKWTDPTNVGLTINTEFDEESPSFHAESKTLYFSSVGHNSMGNYDIFKSTYDESNETWTTPENLGYPINTTDSDIFLAVSTDGKKGYYSSFKKDSRGGNDIYIIDHIDEISEVDTTEEDSAEPIDTIVESEIDTTEIVAKNPINKEKIAKAPQEVTLEIVVTAPGSNIPLPAHFKIIEKASSHVVDDLFLENGVYTKTFTNFVDKEYIIEANAKGYLYQTDKIVVPNQVDEPTEIKHRLPLRNFEKNTEYVFRNIYFEFDKFTLKPESSLELENIYAILKKDQSLKIKIDGHTDKIGSHEYNMYLSQNRANAVKKYLLSKGIQASRIESVGYGETKPMASDDFIELNRRTVFVLKD